MSKCDDHRITTESYLNGMDQNRLMDLQSICANFFQDDINAVSNVIMSYQNQQGKSNKPSKGTFINFIINSKTFQVYYQKLFYKVIDKMINNDMCGCCDTEKIEILKRDLLKTIIQFAQECNEEVVESYIKGSKLFEATYVDLISKTYEHYFTNSLCEEDKTALMDWIKTVQFKNFSVVEINEMIKKKILDLKNDGCAVVERDGESLFTSYYKTKYNTKPKLEDISKYQTFVQDESNVVKMYINSRNNDYSVFQIDVLNKFNEIFQRDITVFEYIKYYNMFVDDEDTDNSVIMRYFETYTKKFNMAYSIYIDYLNEQMSYHYFVKTYLQIIEDDDEGFLDKVILNVTTFIKYTSVMKEKISKIYSTSYTNTISELDLLYFYSEVHAERLSLVDDKLIEKITNLKDETETYISNIDDIFQRILLRKAEERELNVYIEYFRKKDNVLKPGIKLEDELYDSLEYHDILKNIINTHLSKTHEFVSKSLLYTHLNNILQLSDFYVKRDHKKIIASMDGNS